MAENPENFQERLYNISNLDCAFLDLIMPPGVLVKIDSNSLVIKLFGIETFEKYKKKCVLTPKYYKVPQKDLTKKKV